MKAAILDIDSKIPNLALMKISTHLKAKGYDVELFQYNIKAAPGKNKEQIVFDGAGYDIVYASILFTTNKNVLSVLNNLFVNIGGTGHDIDKKLPENIDNLPPDYSLYSENKTSYGFITRGCIRDCYFCFVPRKEGRLKKYNTVKNIVCSEHKKTIFMDNNILAYSKHKDVFREIISLKLKLTFNQGLDIRLNDDENAKLLSEMNYINEYIFAFDDISYQPTIDKKYSIARKHIKKDWKVKFFIYCHPKKTTISSIKKRIEWCYNNKALPYIMRDFDCYDDKHANFYTDIASWCNQPGLFKNMTFKQFISKRENSKKREARSKAIYCVLN